MMLLRYILNSEAYWGEWPSGLGRCYHNQKVNSLGARPGLRTQPRYEVPGDLRVEHVKSQ